jgi:hypothetical protein
MRIELSWVVRGGMQERVVPAGEGWLQHRRKQRFVSHLRNGYISGVSFHLEMAN